MGLEHSHHLTTPSGLGRAWTFDGTRLRTTGLLAPGASTPTPLTLDTEFAITVDGVRLTSADFTCCLVSTAMASHQQTDIIAHWTLPARGLSVRLAYTAHASPEVLRKHLEVTGRGQLTAIELEHWPVNGARGVGGRLEHNQIGMGPMGLGQPVFWNGFFLGVEHPGAENWVTSTHVICRFSCQHTLSTEPFISPPCVQGLAPAGREFDAFCDYIDRLRPHREPPFVVLINNWYQFGRVRHRGVAQLPGSVVLEEMRAFAATIREHGLPLDTYCLDDPWAEAPPLITTPAPGGREPPQTPAEPKTPPPAPLPESWPATSGRGLPGLWNRLSHELFPGGLASLTQAAAPMRVGLWVGPFGGYLGRGPLVAFGKSLGYESWTDTTDTSGFGQEKLCCHGTRYHAHLRESLAHWARLGVRYWKFDGVEFHCNDATHGHPVGPGSETAQMNSWIDLMQAIRHEAPDSIISFTTGSNPSPWWLAHVDFVWRGGGDDRTTAQAAPKRERFATYIDDCLQLLRQTSMPLSAVAVFGLIQNAAVSYASEQESPEAFARALWLMVARGSHHHDLYISPDSLPAWAWPMLSQVLNWARNHRRLLARTRMVLGEPLRGDVYGFVSWREGRGIVALRNPGGAEQTVTATWQDLIPGASVKAGTRLALTPVYGPHPAAPSVRADAPLMLVLPPFGVSVIETAACE